MQSFVSVQNACPPEDCRGVYRYREIIEILGNPSHEDCESRVEWLGPKFDPNKLNRIRIEKDLGILGTKIKGYEKGLNDEFVSRSINFQSDNYSSQSLRILILMQ